MEVTPPSRRATLHGLTGIRFVAALMVLLFHYGSSFAQHAGLPAPIATFMANGYLGVSLFFMLSGFIITYSYDGRLGTVSQLAGFAVARVSRIYPVYLLALIVSLPFAWATLTAGPALAVLAMVQSWTVPGSRLGDSWVTQAWTLSVELFFYLCAPIALWLLRPARTGTLIAVALVCAVLMPLLWIPSVPPGTRVLPFAWEALVPIPLLRLTEFLFGMTLARLFLRHGAVAARLSGSVPVLANVALIVAILAATRDPAVTGGAMVLTGLLLLQLAAGRNVAERVLSSRPLLLLGASSYALYLIQWPVREYLRLLLPGRLDMIANPFVAVGVSVLVYRYWEEPARRWLRDCLLSHRTAR